MKAGAWSERDAADLAASYAERGVSEDLALRVYSARLLGRDPLLVLHGGGNSSVKTTAVDVFGDRVDVLAVKGSGWDMGDIEPPGFPLVRLAPMLRLRELQKLPDEDMVNALRANLLDQAAPNPSVETLLHAFLPHKFIDHTHSTAILSLVNQPNGEELARDVFGDRMAYVPYIMPGFGLSKAAADAFEARPDAEGLILLKHGVFTFGPDARTAYERMIEAAAVAEARLASAANRTLVQIKLPPDLAHAADIAPLIRGACAIRDGDECKRIVATFRATPAILAYVNGAHLANYSQRGVVTPDHVIRTKNTPLVMPPPIAGKLGEFAESLRAGVSAFAKRYDETFAQENARAGGFKVKLDPLPRVVLVPGIGLFGLGASLKDAAIAADLAENTIRVVTDAEAIGRYEALPAADIFDMESCLYRRCERKDARAVELRGSCRRHYQGSHPRG
jgi:rhamnose utilization protein RhaD (predicted bifunctional aldolase and dehydrogenase)